MIFNVSYDESKTKQNQRNIILIEAYKLFIKKGIQNVTMHDIAEASSIQRRTLYYYYESKEAVAKELIKCYISEYQQKTLDIPKHLTTGYAQIEYIFHDFLEFLIENEDAAIFSVHYDYYFNKEHYDGIIEIKNSFEFGIAKSSLDAFKLGIEDGSIKREYAENAEEIIFVSLSSMVSLVNRILFREGIIRKESGYDRKSLSVLLNIILSGLKA